MEDLDLVKEKRLRQKSQPLEFSGAQGQNRTADTWIFSPRLTPS